MEKIQGKIRERNSRNSGKETHKHIQEKMHERNKNRNRKTDKAKTKREKHKHTLTRTENGRSPRKSSEVEEMQAPSVIESVMTKTAFNVRPCVSLAWHCLGPRGK